MPLWFGQENKIVAGSRSNLGLIKSMDHSTPPEEFVVDPTLPVLFQYDYAAPGLQDVVIPKGMMVALTGRYAKDPFTGRKLPEITFADGTNPVIGMAAYNFTQMEDDRFKGNKPLVVNDWYVELPYIPDENDAANVKWGALYGPGIKPGDWLRPGGGANKGKLTLWRPYVPQTERFSFSTGTGETSRTVYTKYPIKPGEAVSVSVVAPSGATGITATATAAFVIEISGLAENTDYTLDLTYVSLVSDPIDQRVAQVLAAELDQEPWGWLRWVMWDETAKREDLEGQPQYGKPGDVQYPWDPNAPGYGYDPRYRQGIWDLPGYQSPYKTPDNARGIPGLTDGGERSKKVWSKSFVIPANTAVNTVIQVQLDYRNVVPGSVEVRVNNIVQDPATYTVDHGAGIVNFVVPESLAGAAQPQAGEVRYRAYFWGTPPGWDYVGSVGAVRVLLHL